jgi:hypothetical protein
VVEPFPALTAGQDVHSIPDGPVLAMLGLGGFPRENAAEGSAPTTGDREDYVGNVSEAGREWGLGAMGMSDLSVWRVEGGSCHP